mmetsp:Transcript_56935/g.162195  ORF Transcript_56935/g.162195 Transcript_56935/m.162195 type:complete len:201 (+) Transcript_56935:190-792(+)
MRGLRPRHLLRVPSWADDPRSGGRAPPQTAKEGARGSGGEVGRGRGGTCGRGRAGPGVFVGHDTAAQVVQGGGLPHAADNRAPRPRGGGGLTEATAARPANGEPRAFRRRPGSKGAAAPGRPRHLCGPHGAVPAGPEACARRQRRGVAGGACHAAAPDHRGVEKDRRGHLARRVAQRRRVEADHQQPSWPPAERHAPPER